jgi:hypothetical protein
MNGDNQLKAVIADIKSIVIFFDDLQKDLSKFIFEEAMQKIEMLNATILYLNAYILGNSNQRD